MFTVFPYNLFGKLFPPVNIRYTAVNCLVFVYNHICALICPRESAIIPDSSSSQQVLPSSSHPLGPRACALGFVERVGRPSRRPFARSCSLTPVVDLSAAPEASSTRRNRLHAPSQVAGRAHFISSPHQLSTRNGAQQADEDERTTRSSSSSDISRSAVSCRSKLARWTKRSSIAVGGGDAFG